MEALSAPPSPPSPRSRARVRIGLCSLLIIFFTIFTLSVPSTTSTPVPFREIPYAKFCNDVVPESTPTGTKLSDHSYLRLENAYFAGGGAILGPQFSGSSPKSLSFRTQNVYTTEANGVIRVEGSVTFWGSRFKRVSGNFSRRNLRLINYRAPRIPVGRYKLGFSVHGFWSEASGKLCMVGSGTSSLSSVNVVLKINYPNTSTLVISLVTGTLESLDTSGSLNHVEPVSILGLSTMNYQYKLIDSENENGGLSNDDNIENMSLGLEFGRSVCSAFMFAGRFELEYMDNCDSVNCSPIGDGGFLPGFMSFNEIECTENWKVRYLLDFSNSSYNGHRLPFDPNTVLVAEGAWNEKKKHLDLVACRITNLKDSVDKASLGDCSVRLSLRLRATLSLRNRSLVVGHMWSNKTVNSSGYFGRVAFHGPRNVKPKVEGLKYDYTELHNVRQFCTKKMTDKHKGGTFPDGYTSDMRFDMTVRYSKGQVAWGHSSPLSVGYRFYDPRSMFGLPAESAVQLNNSKSDVLNISYVLSFTPPPDFRTGGQVSATKSVEISAEGLYNTKTGFLCMIGCRHLESLGNRLTENESFDCEMLISIQYPPLNAKDGSVIKGTIECNRNKSDSLYFERIELTASSIFKSQAEESIWRMDLEIIMVLVSNTLACIFVGLQLFYVKKYPDVIPFISVVMLTVLTLAHMIPLVLNFEALFLGNRNRQNVFLGSGGWLEVNEVLVRVITMIAFLLHFRLLQQTYSARVGDGSWKSLWVSDKKVLYLSLPLYIGGGLVAWFVHQWKYSYKSPLLIPRVYQQQSFWGDFKSYAGLILDGFLLPQFVFNLFCNCREKALAPSFYVGTTVVRLLPHAYDLYRAHGSTWYFSDIYANPRTDYYSTAWDIIISCSGLLFIVLIYLQQRFGGRCFLPKRFRESSVYEKVPVVSSE